MGNFRLGLLKATVGVFLFFFIIPNVAYSRATCESLFLKSEIQSSKLSNGLKLRAKNRLKIANWNILDFKINIDLAEKGDLPYSQNDLHPNEKIGSKTFEQLLQYQRIMRKLDADIYVLPESIGRSIKYFSKHFLENQYQVILDPTKADTEMQIAFLIRKNLDVDIAVRTYSHLTWENKLVSPPKIMRIFHKDMPAIYIREKGASKTDLVMNPDLIILGTHLKSMRNSENDYKSKHQRNVQVQATTKIIDDIEQRVDAPLLLAGDFNIDMSTGVEAAPLKIILKDSIELMDSKFTASQRNTVEYKAWKGLMLRRRLDAQMLNERLAQKLVESSVFYPEEEGFVNPSDHRPVIAVYDMTR